MSLVAQRQPQQQDVLRRTSPEEDPLQEESPELVFYSLAVIKVCKEHCHLVSASTLIWAVFSQDP